MKKSVLYGMIAFAFVAIAIGLLLANKDILNVFNKSKIEVIDASYSCIQQLEQIYEDDEYTYSLPCVKSASIYVKLENGDKVPLVDALRDGKVTIEELIRAGLEIYETKK